MREFLPGDRVSFINDKLSGTVKRIIDKKQVLLLLDDGFEIPVSINELVLMERVGGAVEIQENDLSIIAEEEDKSDKVYFAAVTEDSTKGVIVNTFLVNTTQGMIKFVLFNKTMGQVKGLAQGDLESSRAIKLIQFGITEASDYRNLVLHAIHYAEKPDFIIAPMNISFKLKPVSIIKEQKIIPVLKQKGLLINLTDYQQTNENISIDKSVNPVNISKPEPPADLIDLHLEELSESPKLLLPHAAFELQMKVFSNSLENALAHNINNITFIHGVGQGKLKTEIRKSLDLNPHVKGFEDADYKKFGYGATIVYLKSR